jgi:hypothetical protein
MVRLSTAAAVSLAIVGSSEAFVQSPLMKGTSSLHLLVACN